MYTTKSISDLSFTAVPLPRETLYNKSIQISNMYTTKSISDLSFTAVPSGSLGKGTAVKDKSDIDLVVYMLDICILLL
jgi:tRNA nucleotidyltransferase (CCA-adding enzyme)